MSIIQGWSAKVCIGTATVSEIGQFSFSGVTRETIEHTSFGDTYRKYVFGFADGGEISFAGNWDPNDTTGQKILDSACINGSVFTGGDLRFYIDNTSYYTVDTGGNILITKSRAISLDKAGIGTTEFTGKVSGKALILI